MTQSKPRQGNILFLALSVGLTLWIASPGVSVALQKKDAIYNECACACDGPTGGGIIDIRNTGGFSCGAYNGKTCNYEDPATGGIRSGTTKWCTPYKPSGTRAAALPRKDMNSAVMSRGVEGESPTVEEEKAGPDPAGEVQERAVPRQGLPGKALSFTGCGCKGGAGTCTVSTSPVPGGDSQTCAKGASDTCTGQCDFSWVKSSGRTLRPQ